MVAIAYLIPAIACILLHFEFDYAGKWTAYLWIILFGEATVGLLHFLLYRFYTSKTEFLGSIVSDINYEESWTELVEVNETKTSSNGKSYTVTRIEERFHKEKYYFHTTRGTAFDTDYTFYNYVRQIWQLAGFDLSWSGKNIKGGHRYGRRFKLSEFDEFEREKPKNWIPITEENSYINKIQASNSIFKFEKIDSKEATELGLLDYPEIRSHDAPCILSKEISIPSEADELFRKFNDKIAPEFQMRLYILLFDASKGIGISELQRAYWQGGNKNEFVVCIGMKPDSEIAWARAFSWADEQNKEVETAQWLMHHSPLNWQQFYHWLQLHLRDWKRKEFKDFNYINITLPLWQVITLYSLSVAENALALYLAL